MIVRMKICVHGYMFMVGVYAWSWLCMRDRCVCMARVCMVHIYVRGGCVHMVLGVYAWWV